MIYSSSNRSKLNNGLNYNKTAFVLVIIPGSISVLSNKLTVPSKNHDFVFIRI